MYDSDGNSVLDETEQELRSKAFQYQEDNADDVHVIEASGWKDARTQVVDYQKGDGNTVDSLNFYGHGNENGQFVGATKGGASDKQLESGDLKSFYGADKNGDKIEIESGGHINYYGCEVASGKSGDNYLSQSANLSGRRALGLAATRKVYGLGPEGNRIYWDRARANQGMFGEEVDVGPASKHAKYADPGQPVKYTKEENTRSELRKYHNRKI